MTEPLTPCDTITVTTLATAEVSATHAELFVRIQGGSFFSGQLALTRAREVAQFVGALKELGLAERDIQLQGVMVSESSGMLSKSSAALYDLKVRCEPLDRLAELLGAITAQKNIQLQKLQWSYDNLETLRDTLQDHCLTELNRRASRIAVGLGVTLQGVHRYEEQWTYPQGEERVMIGSVAPQMRDSSKSRMLRTVDMGIAYSHHESIKLLVEAEFHISRFVERIPPAD